MKAGERTLSGKVIRKQFAAGSKSEHDAVFLDTGETSYKLKKAGGNPFYDASLEKLVGKKVSATGIINDYLFIVTEIKIISG